MKITTRQIYARLETDKNHNYERLVFRFGLEVFLKLLNEGLFVWVKDDSFGNKLYKKTKSSY